MAGLGTIDILSQQWWWGTRNLSLLRSIFSQFWGQVKWKVCSSDIIAQTCNPNTQRLMQEDHEFEDSLGYTYLKKKTKTKLGY